MRLLGPLIAVRYRLGLLARLALRFRRRKSRVKGGFNGRGTDVYDTRTLFYAIPSENKRYQNVPILKYLGGQKVDRKVHTKPPQVVSKLFDCLSLILAQLQPAIGSDDNRTRQKQKLVQIDLSVSVEPKRTLDNPGGARGGDRLPSPKRIELTSDLAPTTKEWGKITSHNNLATYQPIYFQISKVPLDWSEDDLRDALESIDSSSTDQTARLSLYPTCSGPTQTALLNLDTCSEYFRNLNPNDSKYVQTSLVGKAEVILALDSHFYDLTPLNTPGDKVVADDWACGSWRSRKAHQMWLPQDVKDIRIMSYSYNSNLVGNTGSLDYRRHFIQMLTNARSSAEETSQPIIFIAHSMGGIFVFQALLQFKNGGQYQQIFDSTRAIIFFGTPHQGLEVEELLSMVEDISLDQETSSRSNLVRQLGEGSNFLDTHQTIFQVKMAKNNSALLYQLFEEQLPVDKNHTEMVKFNSSSDKTYQTVVLNMKGWVDKIDKLLTKILTEEHRKCLKSLKAFDYESYRDAVLLKRHENTCTWLLADERYRNWVEKDDQPVLWIHGGPGFGKSVLFSVLTKDLPEDTRSASGKIIQWLISFATTRMSD
ncbi:hypothetical protein BDD12DRAFT_804253 [Trichophaea hybrida]|nr:hypothetical protein BDD12DRAFT_804253 [Trichophaea hybrida]